MSKDSRKILCSAKGGSHSYGLSTPASDIDLRGIFVNTDVGHLVGLKRDQVLTNQTEEKDIVMTEFRHALRLLRNANTQIIELLYATRFDTLDPLWLEVQSYKHRLVSSETLFKCLRGYMQGELRLANGERTGKLGGKRKEAIDTYGFSPKNFCQLFRLAKAGRAYFETGLFPVNIMEYDPEYGKYLLDIKLNPQNYHREVLNNSAIGAEELLVKSYENRKVHTEFDDGIANDLCVKVYKPLIAAL